MKCNVIMRPVPHYIFLIQQWDEFGGLETWKEGWKKLRASREECFKWGMRPTNALFPCLGLEEN